MTQASAEARQAERPTSRQNNVGALRLALAFLVLLSHSPELLDGNRSRELLTRVFHTLSFGELAVDGFFILSGALITASFLGSRSPGGYLVKRLLRIYPGFVVASVFCVFLVAPLAGGTLDPQGGAFWRGLVKRCVLLEVPGVPGALVGNPYPSLNGSIWTIRYEFLAYLAVLLLGALGLLRRRFVVASAICLVVATPLLQLPALASWREMQPRQHVVDIESLVRFLGLFASGAAFHLYRDRIVYSRRGAAAAAIVLMLSLASWKAAHIGVATAGAYLLFFFGLHFRSDRLSRVGTRNDLSYGVYLYAWPVQSLLVWSVPTMSPWTLFFVSAAVTSVLAWLSWVAVERPALRLKPVTPRRTATAGAASA